MNTFNLLAPLPDDALLPLWWLGRPAFELLQLEFSHARADVLYAPTGTGKTAALLRMAALLEPDGARPHDATADINCPADEDCP